MKNKLFSTLITIAVMITVLMPVGNVYASRDPSLPPATIFQNGKIRVWTDQNLGRMNVDVCASNLSNQVVYLGVSSIQPGRVSRTVYYSQKATSTCVTFWSMGGPGPLSRNATYEVRASLNQKPNPSWPIPCYATGGQGLCARWP